MTKQYKVFLWNLSLVFLLFAVLFRSCKEDFRRASALLARVSALLQLKRLIPTHERWKNPKMLQSFTSNERVTSVQTKRPRTETSSGDGHVSPTRLLFSSASVLFCSNIIACTRTAHRFIRAIGWEPQYQNSQKHPETLRFIHSSNQDSVHYSSRTWTTYG